MSDFNAMLNSAQASAAAGPGPIAPGVNHGAQPTAQQVRLPPGMSPE
mgnify:CR=1 FL=1|tara:strand:+ start:82 stop:222 length:141 start_codon:yes stop_codon:yes gene_type:complete